MAGVLVTRPAALAVKTGALLHAAGHEVWLSPLLLPEPVAWDLPVTRPDALILTSPQAARLAGPQLAALAEVPVWAVGRQTAMAAEAAGLHVVHIGSADGGVLLAAATGAGHRTLLHLAGADRTPVAVPDSATLMVRTVYSARLTDSFTAEARAALETGRIDWALLFSSRSAARFAELYDRLGRDRAAIAIGAISPQSLSAAGPGWAAGVAAARPSTDALLAAAGLACDKDATQSEDAHDDG